MDINVVTEGNVTIVQLVGYVDTRASVDFEKKMLELLQGGVRLFGFDFTKVDMLTSAGIRVLMMTAKRVGGGNRLALWGLNDQIKTVFSIAGLVGHLPIVDSQADAIALLTSASAAASRAELSKMARLVTRILGIEAAAPAPPGEAGRPSALAAEVARALSR